MPRPGRGEQAPWSETARTREHLLQLLQALWTVVDQDSVEPTNHGAEEVQRWGRDVWEFLEQAWSVHRHGGERPCPAPWMDMTGDQARRSWRVNSPAIPPRWILWGRRQDGRAHANGRGFWSR